MDYKQCNDKVHIMLLLFSEIKQNLEQISRNSGTVTTGIHITKVAKYSTVYTN